nr:hypothetical protein [Pseudomonas sp. SWRI 103]
MPHICQFLGVNSVTNIELTKGFMPALICIFADWLEKPGHARFPKGTSRKSRRHRVSGRTS